MSRALVDRQTDAAVECLLKALIAVPQIGANSVTSICSGLVARSVVQLSIELVVDCSTICGPML